MSKVESEHVEGETKTSRRARRGIITIGSLRLPVDSRFTLAIGESEIAFKGERVIADKANVTSGITPEQNEEDETSEPGGGDGGGSTGG